MSRDRAVKTALLGYAKQNNVEIPRGFNHKANSFGRPAFELVKRVQEKSNLDPDGKVGPYTLLSIGRFFPGRRVGQKAMWAMIAMEGPLETGGNNIGPSVQAIQKLGSDLYPGSWPWCAAATSWALRCAGWKHWHAFVRNEPEAWVQGWVNSARSKEHGMRTVNWRAARQGDFICLNFDSSEPYDHIGVNRSRANQRTGTILTVEGNTSSGRSGSQDDGAGMWRRQRTATGQTVFVRVD